MIERRGDEIDPAAVPRRTLASGDEVPAIGLGTFGSDRVDAATIGRAVASAAAVGYRHFDCAAVYGNEASVGAALQEVVSRGVARAELWITSKLWNDQHAAGDVLPACERSLADLRLDYLDLYLVHWPFPNFHPPGCDGDSRSPEARPYVHERFMDTWRQMEELVALGLVRNIGTSNVTVRKLVRILGDATVPPAANQMELHPHFQQPELFAFCRENDVLPIGYCPIGSPGRPDRDRAPDDTVDTEDPVILDIAVRHGIHPAALCVKWAAQRGQVPIPMSTTRAHLLANLAAVCADPLTPEEMRAIAAIDRRCRLIKGQVFLWEGATDWRELWDEAGPMLDR